jgi:hypothetical protein
MSRGDGRFDNNNSNNNIKPIVIQTGRGADLMISNNSFKPPDKDDNVKVRKTKYGTLKITKVEDNKKKDDGDDIDKDGNLNWEKLDKKHKHKPCVKLLKQLKKKEQKVKNKYDKKSLGEFFFDNIY